MTVHIILEGNGRAAALAAVQRAHAPGAPRGEQAEQILVSSPPQPIERTETVPTMIRALLALPGALYQSTGPYGRGPVDTRPYPTPPSPESERATMGRAAMKRARKAALRVEQAARAALPAASLSASLPGHDPPLYDADRRDADAALLERCGFRVWSFASSAVASIGVHGWASVLEADGYAVAGAVERWYRGGGLIVASNLHPVVRP